MSVYFSVDILCGHCPLVEGSIEGIFQDVFS